jgi:hypothetical protein
MESNFDFAAMNYQNFSLQDRKTNYFTVLGIVALVAGGIALYYYIENSKNESKLIRLSDELTIVRDN